MVAFINTEYILGTCNVYTVPTKQAEIAWTLYFSVLARLATYIFHLPRALFHAVDTVVVIEQHRAVPQRHCSGKYLHISVDGTSDIVT